MGVGGWISNVLYNVMSLTPCCSGMWDGEQICRPCPYRAINAPWCAAASCFVCAWRSLRVTIVKINKFLFSSIPSCPTIRVCSKYVLLYLQNDRESRVANSAVASNRQAFNRGRENLLLIARFFFFFLLLLFLSSYPLSFTK